MPLYAGRTRRGRGYGGYVYSATTGNLSQKAGVSYTYSDSEHKHAVTSAGGVTYGYDSNGNMTSRVAGGVTYTLSYDLHNRLTSISGNGSTSTFVYDSDGNRVKGTVNGVTTVYLGSYYEKIGNNIKTYYYAGGTRVAMNETGQVTKYMIGDHLGSTSLMVTASGTRVAGAQYEAWGENRGTLEDLRTSFRFTGQRKENIPGWAEGLYFYNARWYDPALSRFLSADSIIPNGWDPVAFDRYAYVRNSPAMYTDPSGHDICHGPAGAKECADAGGNDPDYEPVSDAKIPDPTYYPCIPKPGYDCLSPDMDPQLLISLAIGGEGGNLSERAAADILQTLINRAYYYWTTQHDGINPDNRSWESITEDELTDLLLFILSEPAIDSNGIYHPAYNAWEDPQSTGSVYFTKIQNAVSDVLGSPGVMPNIVPIMIGETPPDPEVRNNTAVMYFASSLTEKKWEPDWKVVLRFTIVLADPSYNTDMFFDVNPMDPPD